MLRLPSFIIFILLWSLASVADDKDLCYDQNHNHPFGQTHKLNIKDIIVALDEPSPFPPKLESWFTKMKGSGVLKDTDSAMVELAMNQYQKKFPDVNWDTWQCKYWVEMTPDTDYAPTEFKTQILDRLQQEEVPFVNFEDFGTRKLTKVPGLKKTEKCEDEACWKKKIDDMIYESRVNNLPMLTFWVYKGAQTQFAAAMKYLLDIQKTSKPGQVKIHFGYAPREGKESQRFFKMEEMPDLKDPNPSWSKTYRYGVVNMNCQSEESMKDEMDKKQLADQKAANDLRDKLSQNEFSQAKSMLDDNRKRLQDASNKVQNIQTKATNATAKLSTPEELDLAKKNVDIRVANRKNERDRDFAERSKNAGNKKRTTTQKRLSDIDDQIEQLKKQLEETPEEEDPGTEGTKSIKVKTKISEDIPIEEKLRLEKEAKKKKKKGPKQPKVKKIKQPKVKQPKVKKIKQKKVKEPKAKKQKTPKPEGTEEAKIRKQKVKEPKTLKQPVIPPVTVTPPPLTPPPAADPKEKKEKPLKEPKEKKPKEQKEPKEPKKPKKPKPLEPEEPKDKKELKELFGGKKAKELQPYVGDDPSSEKINTIEPEEEEEPRKKPKDLKDPNEKRKRRGEGLEGEDIDPNSDDPNSEKLGKGDDKKAKELKDPESKEDPLNGEPGPKFKTITRTETSVIPGTPGTPGTKKKGGAEQVPGVKIKEPKVLKNPPQKDKEPGTSQVVENAINQNPGDKEKEKVLDPKPIVPLIEGLGDKKKGDIANVKEKFKDEQKLKKLKIKNSVKAKEEIYENYKEAKLAKIKVQKEKEKAIKKLLKKAITHELYIEEDPIERPKVEGIDCGIDFDKEAADQARKRKKDQESLSNGECPKNQKIKQTRAERLKKPKVDINKKPKKRK